MLVNRHIHPFNFYDFDPRLENLVGCANDFDREPFELRRSSLVGNCHPYCVRQLGRQLMIAQRADQADNSIWDQASCFSQTVSHMFACAFWILVEASAKAN